MRYNEITEAAETRGWRCILVYGSFTDATTGQNFFVLRMPEGRVPWSRKIVPAIDKLVRSMFTQEERRNAANRRRMGRENLIHWNVEGDDVEENGGKTLWDLQKPVSRYEWDGAALVKVEWPASTATEA